MIRRTQWTDPTACANLCLLAIDDRKGNPARANSLPPFLYNYGIAPFLHFDEPLPDQLYVLGGRSQQQDSLDTVEMFDTWHGQWVACPSMTSRRAGCAAALLPDRRLLVVGGYDHGGIVKGVLATCEVYDPVRRVWDPSSAALRRSRWGHGCATLGGRVYAAGGCSLRPGMPAGEDFMETLRCCEVYDPQADSWSVAAGFNVARAGLRLVTLTETRLAAVGGCDDVFGRAVMLTSVEIFESASGCWSLLDTQLSIPRTTSAVVALDRSQILVMGGAPSLASAEVYHATTGKPARDGATAEHLRPRPLAEMAEGRMGCQAVAMKLPKSDQKYPVCTTPCVVVVGGENGDEDLDSDYESVKQFSSVLVYDVEAGSWQPSDSVPPIPTPRTAMALCVAPGWVAGHL